MPFPVAAHLSASLRGAPHRIATQRTSHSFGDFEMPFPVAAHLSASRRGAPHRIATHQPSTNPKEP